MSRLAALLLCWACLAACAANPATFSGTPPPRNHPAMQNTTFSDTPAIVRDAATKTAILVIPVSFANAAQAWHLYQQPAPSGEKRPVLEGNGPGAFSLPETNRSWMRFLLVSQERELTLAERHLPMAGGYNFRDLGGMAGADGRRVAWGKLFRSDDLKNLTPGDLTYLASIPVTTIIDFRTDREAQNAPDKLPSSGTRYLHLPMLPGNINASTVMKDKAVKGDAFMTDLYREFVRDEHVVGTYRSFFARVQNEKNLPLLFHCSAGKDRTGVAAALILLALGVDRETVFADYISSNTYLADKYAEDIKANPSMTAMFTVNPAYLEAALEEMEKSHGSVTAYLEQVLGVDVARMRRMFLE